MRRYLAVLLFLLLSAALSGCSVPTPPPELPTATPGSQNPESPLSALHLTPTRPTPERDLTPLPEGPGHIYFVRDTGLWRISPDGSGEEHLSDLPVAGPPQPSPDGSVVAFISGKSVYVVPSGGGEAREVASGELAQSQRLGWSPDGSLVGYVAYDPTTPGRRQVWAVPSAGGEPQLIVTLDEGAPGRGPKYESSVKWSPDGRWVLAGGVNNPSRLLRWPHTGRPDDVRGIIGGEPDWSPDSRTVVYAETINGALGIYNVIEADAIPFRTEQQLVGTRTGEYAQGPAPLWSPASVGADSDLIAYRSRSSSGDLQVAIRRRGGRELEPVPGANNPAWSPSGDRMVVETGDLKQDPLGMIWVPNGLAIAGINPDGQHTVTPLVKDGRWPVWGRQPKT